MDEIIDTSLKPPTDGPRATLFRLQNRYMFSVFAKTLKTDFGKFLIRMHSPTFDAHTIFCQLVKHAQESTTASINASALLAYITSIRLGDGEWTGPSESFILHWQDQVRKYEMLVDITERFSDAVKRSMLRNAVSNIPELNGVKLQTDKFQTQMHK